MQSEIDKELAELEQKIESASEAQAKPIESQTEPVQPENVEEPVQKEAGTSVNQDESSKEFDATEWVKKKGWKTPEDAAKSLRSLEQEFHKKNQELNQLKAQQNYTPPENPYTPPAPYGYPPPPPPAYQPPASEPSYAQRINEEQIAASYNLSVDDFRKVVAVSRDIAEAQTRRYQQEINAWREQMTRETEKSSDMASLVADPAFHNPEVQIEMNQILSKNPALFTQARPYSNALREALANIGRRKTMGGSNIESPSFPNQPPKPAGSSSGFSGRKNSAMPSQQDFEKMTPENQEKILKSLNAFKTYDDYR